MFVSHGQQPGEEDSIWCLLLTFCQQYHQTVHVDVKTRDGLLTQEQKYHSLNWLTKLTKPITATEQTYPSYCAICQKRVHTNNFEMCLGLFNFHFLGEIPHFLVSNTFIGHILDGNGIRFAVAPLISHHENKDVCCANSLFLEEVPQELQIAGELSYP